MKRLLIASVCSFVCLAPAQAAVSSSFAANNDGWLIGSMDAAAYPQGPAIWNAGGYLQTTDVAGEVAFFAPSKFLGNQSGAYGSTITYDTGDTENDGVLYAALVLYGNGQAISIGHLPPATSGVSNFAFTLTENGFSNYIGGGIQSSAAVGQAAFQAVLGNLTAIAFHADWHTGSDYSTLDNVVLGGTGTGAVPEPASWALMLAGFGVVGGALRRRQQRSAVALA